MSEVRLQTKLNNIFDKNINSYTYAKGIREFETILENNVLLLKPINFIRLGLLYDHLALERKADRNSLNKKAINLYKRAIQIDPNFASAWWGIGRVLWHKSDIEALPFAKKAYRLAKKGNLENVGQYAQNIGLIYRDFGNNKNAERWLKQGVVESPNEWGTYYNLLSFYTKTGKKRNIQGYIEKLQELLKKSPERNTSWGKQIKAFVENLESESK